MERWRVALVKVESIRGKYPRSHYPGKSGELLKRLRRESIWARSLRCFQQPDASIRRNIHLAERARRGKVGSADPVNTVTFSIERLEEFCKP